MDADLGEGAAGHRVISLPPSPNLCCVNMHEIGATAHCTLFSQIAGSGCGGIVDKNCAVAIGKAANQGTTRVLVDV